MADNGIELATAYVSLVASTGSLARSVAPELAAVERRTGETGKKAGGRLRSGMLLGIGRMAGPLVAALGVGAVIKGVGDMIGAASDLQQSVGGVEAVFGKYAKGVKKDSEGAAQSVGLSKNAYNELITVSGALLKNKGISDFAGQSKNLINIGADLSAQFGGSTKDAVDALNAAMRGESDPIERYGVSLNETSVNAFLAAKGLSKLKGPALEQAKTQARLALITKQTADAHGAFARESDTLAGKQQRVSAAFENVKATIGTALLPAMAGITEVAGKVVAWLAEKIPTALKFLSDTFSPVIDTVKLFIGTLTGEGADVELPWANTVIDVGGQVAGVIDTIKTGVGAFFTALRDGDVTSEGFVGVMETIGDFLHRMLPQAVAVAKAAFETVVAFIRDQVIPRFMGIVSAVGAFVQAAVPIVIDFVGRVIALFRSFMPTIRQILGIVGQIITGALDAIRATIERITTIIKFIWTNWGQGILDWIKIIWTAILNVIKPALETIRAVIRTVTALMKGDWAGVWQGIKDIVSSAWDTIKAVVGGALGILKQALSTAWSAIKGVASAAWGGIVSAISKAWGKVVGFIQGPIDRVLQFIQENLIDKINGLFSFLNINLHINPIWTANGAALRASRGAGSANAAERGGFARGGVLPGYTPGRDVHQFFSPTGGRLSLSGGEGILIPQATRAFGGRAGIAAINKYFRMGQSFAGGGIFEAIGNAANGFLGFVTDPLGSLRRLADNVLSGISGNPLVQMVAGMFKRLVAGVAEKASALFGTATGGGSIPAVGVNVNGKTLDSDTLRRIRAAGGGFTVIQGSRSFNPLSKGTHAGWGAADLVTRDWMGGVARLRAQGLLAMFRNWTGNQHIHALNPFVQGLSPQALAQVRRARANNGIFGAGGIFQPQSIRLASFDTGGLLQPGWTLAHNGLGYPEQVGGSGLTDRDLDRLAETLYGAVRAGMDDGQADRARTDRRRSRALTGARG